MEEKVIRRVVVPLDGSAISEQALRVAAMVARRTGATLRLAHVREGDDEAGGYPTGLAASPDLQGIDVHVAVLTGEVRQALMQDAQAWDADLMIMTSRGHGGLKRAILGSVADELVRQSRIPVLLVRPHETAAPAPDELVRALVPLTGQPESEAILPHALALTGTDGAHYELMRTLPTPVEFDRPSSGRILGGPELPPDDAYLSTLAARLAERGVLTSIRPPERGDPAEAILRVAAEGNADLIALTTRGLGGLDRAIFGSTADEVLRKAHCAVLVLRGEPEDAARDVQQQAAG